MAEVASNDTTNLAPAEGQCAFYLDKKRRFCRFRPNKDQKYCAEHACILGIQLGRKRIPCPLNPKHSCYEDSLKKHLKKCPFREQPQESYFHRGINSGDDGGERAPEPRASVHNAPKEEILLLIEKVNRLYGELIGSIRCEISTHSCLKEELENSSYGIQALRHRLQQASLLGLMEKRDLLKSGCSFVELGAGKGQLSHWVQKAVVDCQDVTFTLVDRSSTRYKFDNVHKYDEKSPMFERLRIDLEHLDMSKVESLARRDRTLVAMGKHLCGAATDLALRCLMETLNLREEMSGQEEPSSKKPRTEEDVGKRLPGGVVIALCCHHQCQWRPYVGKAFLQGLGLTARDFQLLTSLSSWATCAWRGWRDLPENQRIGGNQNCGEGSQQEGKNQQQKEEQKEEEQEREEQQEELEEHDAEEEPEQTSTQIQSLLQLSQKEREEIGRRCKRLLDFGRVEFLRGHGLNCHLCQYVQDVHTPENVALIATQ